MTDFDRAKELGISSVYARGFMPYKKVGGNIRVDFDSAVQQLAQDAAPTTAMGVGVPSSLVTFIDPEVVPILFAKQNATKIFDETKKGDRTDKHYQFKLEEYAGNVTPYSDFAENISSDVNYEYPERQNFLFQTVIKYGDLEEEVASRAGIQLASSKQKAAAFSLSTAHNRFYLYGVQGKRIYGMLNDPNLYAAITPISVSGNSTWATKIAADPDGAANIIFNDIAKLWNSLTARNGGNIDKNSPIVLALSNSVSSYLIIPNKFGLTAEDMLKKQFPNMTIVELPELSTPSGELLYMTVPEVQGVKTAFCAYSEKMRLGRVIPELSSYKQKSMGGTWGCVVARPSLIAMMSGV